MPIHLIIWSVGQGVKTPPFHGGNTGSNPVRTIVLNELRRLLVNLLFYYVTFSPSRSVRYVTINHPLELDGWGLIKKVL